MLYFSIYSLCFLVRVSASLAMVSAELYLQLGSRAMAALSTALWYLVRSTPNLRSWACRAVDC